VVIKVLKPSIFLILPLSSKEENQKRNKNSAEPPIRAKHRAAY
jgi:hypothetical protein